MSVLPYETATAGDLLPAPEEPKVVNLSGNIDKARRIGNLECGKAIRSGA